MGRTDEYYEMKELAKQKAREADQQARDASTAPKVDPQQEALSLIRARPEYKGTYDKYFESYKKSGPGAELDLRRQFPRGGVLRDSDSLYGVGPTSDQRRPFERGSQANVEDFYAFTVGDLIGKRFRDSDTYTGWRPNEEGKPEGVGASWNTDSLAEDADSLLARLPPRLAQVLGSNPPDVWAKNADPDAVRRLAQLEAYFAATKASGGYPDDRKIPGFGMAPESREDYKPPRLKMLEPREK